MSLQKQKKIVAAPLLQQTLGLLEHIKAFTKINLPMEICKDKTLL